ncbi:MAG TPA: STAS domain-containing protein [Solirubrobacteraceae bacterium]|jgi:anti-anti-sigma factor
MRPGELAIDRRTENGNHTLALAGELDLASARGLEQIVAEICATDAKRIVVELSKVTFIDSSGLRALLGSREICAAHGHELTLSGCTDYVRKLLELTGLDSVLSCDGTAS